ncbi:phage baseplate assembly protein [Salmonella enterica subsp. enterica]|nr:phage baseplate assembly protein [Salmonella enterica subsp. enterica]
MIAGEPKAGVEHLEPYGFTSSRANSGAKRGVVSGWRPFSCGGCYGVDRRYRLKGLQTGEVAVYDDQAVRDADPGGSVGRCR